MNNSFIKYFSGFLFGLFVTHICVTFASENKYLTDLFQSNSGDYTVLSSSFNTGSIDASFIQNNSLKQNNFSGDGYVNKLNIQTITGKKIINNLFLKIYPLIGDNYNCDMLVSRKFIQERVDRALSTNITDTVYQNTLCN